MLKETEKHLANAQAELALAHLSALKEDRNFAHDVAQVLFVVKGTHDACTRKNHATKPHHD